MVSALLEEVGAELHAHTLLFGLAGKASVVDASGFRPSPSSPSGSNRKGPC